MQTGIVTLDRISHGDNSRQTGRQIKYEDTRDNVIRDLIDLLPTTVIASPLVSSSVYRLDGSIEIHLENNFFKLVGHFTPDKASIFY